MDKFDISKNYLVIWTLWSLNNSSWGIIIPICPMHAFSSLEDIMLLCVWCCHCIHFAFTHQHLVCICIFFHHFCYWNIWFSFVLFFFIFIIENSYVHEVVSWSGLICCKSSSCLSVSHFFAIRTFDFHLHCSFSSLLLKCLAYTNSFITIGFGLLQITFTLKHRSCFPYFLFIFCNIVYLCRPFFLWKYFQPCWMIIVMASPWCPHAPSIVQSLQSPQI